MICRESAGCPMRSRRAAFDTVPSSATATKVLKRLRSISVFLCLVGMKYQSNYALDMTPLHGQCFYQRPLEHRLMRGIASVLRAMRTSPRALKVLCRHVLMNA